MTDLAQKTNEAQKTNKAQIASRLAFFFCPMLLNKITSL
jgi:hypothetical protein